MEDFDEAGATMLQLDTPLEERILEDLCGGAGTQPLLQGLHLHASQHTPQTLETEQGGSLQQDLHVNGLDHASDNDERLEEAQLSQWQDGTLVEGPTGGGAKELPAAESGVPSEAFPSAVESSQLLPAEAEAPPPSSPAHRTRTDGTAPRHPRNMPAIPAASVRVPPGLAMPAGGASIAASTATARPRGRRGRTSCP